MERFDEQPIQGECYSYVKDEKIISLFASCRRQGVAAATNRSDQIWTIIPAILSQIQRFPQAAEMDIHRPILDINAMPPNVIEQLIAAKDLPRALHQQG